VGGRESPTAPPLAPGGVFPIQPPGSRPAGFPGRPGAAAPGPAITRPPGRVPPFFRPPTWQVVEG